MQQNRITPPTSFLQTAHEVERWAGVAMATAVVAYGLSRRSLRGVAMAAAAAPLAFRGITGAWPGIANGAADTRTALGGHRGTHVREAIQLDVPLDVVYGFWRRLENLPRFMTHLDAVKQTSDTVSEWTAHGPAGASVSWRAEIINDIPNELIAWRSLDGSAVVSAGSVRFDDGGHERGTLVRVRMQYSPPGGKLGTLAARLTGRDAATQVREDLRRFKQLLEAGEVATTKGQPRGAA